jgi:hypothetical protein
MARSLQNFSREKEKRKTKKKKKKKLGSAARDYFFSLILSWLVAADTATDNAQPEQLAPHLGRLMKKNAFFLKKKEKEKKKAQ